MSDLHDGFRNPARARAQELTEFLRGADANPNVRAIQQAMRQALNLTPRARLLDAGCGIGLEAGRLATEHPELAVTGVDQNAELLAIARSQPTDAQWVQGDLAALEFADASFDCVRTERVLMYVPDLDRAVDELVRVLAPGGRIALFEFDYGALILPGGDVVRFVLDRLEASIPQPRAARQLPSLLAERGLADVAVQPFSFVMPPPLWQRIVHDTLCADGEPDPALRGWLDTQSAGGFLGVATGLLTTAG